MRVRTQLYSAAYALDRCRVIEGVSGRKYNVEVFSPAGKCFEPGLHSLVESAWDTPGIRQTVRAAMLERLTGITLVDCDQECDCKDREDY